MQIQPFQVWSVLDLRGVQKYWQMKKGDRYWLA